TPDAIARAMQEKAAVIAARETALWANGSAPGALQASGSALSALHVAPGAEAALAKERGGVATVGGVRIVGPIPMGAPLVTPIEIATEKPPGHSTIVFGPEGLNPQEQAKPAAQAASEPR
ncbi:MAG: hypothetical protein L0206_25970, partial [Actinobacteria bacterium]|nr:hypothetical protein [Actinomycetota bacterium]